MSVRTLIERIKNEKVRKSFRVLDPTTEEHISMARKTNGMVHPFDVLKDLNEADLGIYISLSQMLLEEEIRRKYGRSFFEEIGCAHCGRKFSLTYDIPHNLIKFHGIPIHFGCLGDYIKEHGRAFSEKDIRYLARI